MRPTIDIAGEDEGVTLVVRTDYSDETAWRSVVALLDSPPFDGAEPVNRYVDDPAWAGATVDEVLTAAPPLYGVVFVADAATMLPPHPLVAVNTRRPEDPDDYAYEMEYGREFRALPAGVYDVSANLFVDNMTFPEFASSARRDPTGHYRGLVASDRGRAALEELMGGFGSTGHTG